MFLFSSNIERYKKLKSILFISDIEIIRIVQYKNSHQTYMHIG